MPWGGNRIRPGPRPPSRHRPEERKVTGEAVRRVLAIAMQIGAGHRVSVYTIMADYGVSLATAKRDVTMLAYTLPVSYDCEDAGSSIKYLRIVRGGSLLKLLRAEAA